MSEQELWWLALGIGGLVVVVVAVLLGWIIAAARSIDRHAEAIWTTGKEIAGNTVSIWMLEKVNRNLETVGRSLRSLDASLDGLDEELEAGRDPPGARRER